MLALARQEFVEALGGMVLQAGEDVGEPSVRISLALTDFLRNAYANIPAVVEAMRQYWMPMRYPRAH